MKVVFLDFDGVLNHRDYLMRAERKDPPTRAEGKTAIRLRNAVSSEHYTLATAMFDIRSLDPACVERVQKLISETGAKVVVSSSWRHGQTVRGLQILLGHHGLDPSVVIDVTPRNLTTPQGVFDSIRGHEIQAWIDEHPDVEGVVILDDDEDMDYLNDRLVKTSIQTGITLDDVQMAAQVLAQPYRRSSRAPAY